MPQGDWRKALEEEWAHVSAPAALRADKESRCFNLAALRSKAKLKQPPPCGGGCRPKGSLPEVLKVGSLSVFVDDRAIACSSAQLAVPAMQTWQQCEAKDLNWAPGKFEQDATFVGPSRSLGIDFCPQHEVLPATAQKRVDSAWKFLPRLMVLRVLRFFKELLYRTRCCLLVSRGFWFHGHTLAEQILDRRIFHAQRMGSRAPWILLQGHWLSPIVSANIAAVCSSIRAVNFWHRRGDTFTRCPWISCILNIVLKACFLEVNLFVWQHPLFGIVRFTTRDFIQISISQHIAHMLREVWRRELFQPFFGNNRRDSSYLLQSGAGYCEPQLAMARRLFSRATSHQRAVMVGAAISFVVYQKIEHRVIVVFCPYCHCAGGITSLSRFCPFFL
jgi:hypothetical protein